MADAADFVAVTRAGLFAAVLERVFVLVAGSFVVDAGSVFAADAALRERDVAAGLRAAVAAATRRGLVATLEVAPALESRSCRAGASDDALGDADALGAEDSAGAGCRSSNRWRTRLCASFCLLRA